MKINVFTFIIITIMFLVNINAQSNISLNEIYSRGTVSEPDWIEIYNSSGGVIDISGYKIYDIGGQNGTKPKKIFPSGSTIPALGFIVIVTDDTSASGFGLSSSGESVWIENSAGGIVDSVDFPSLQVTESYSRIPNGANWLITNSITQGTSNIYSNPTTLIINEIYSRGTLSDPDWIELYNPSSTEINISGYKIYDIAGQNGTKPKKEIPLGTLIPANGFFVVVTDDTSESGFGLSSNGEEVWLEDFNGLIIDDVSFPAMDTTQSYVRFPDGTASWRLSDFITKGFPNSITNIEESDNEILSYSLSQNFPNPFNPITTINYTIPKTSNVSIKLFNILGEEIATLVNETKNAGNYSILFNAIGLSSGIYFYQIKTNDFIATRKFTLTK